MVKFIPYDTNGISIEIPNELIKDTTYLGFLMNNVRSVDGIHVSINFDGLLAIKDFLETGYFYNPHSVENKDRLKIKDIYGSFEDSLDFLGYLDYDFRIDEFQDDIDEYEHDCEYYGDDVDDYQIEEDDLFDEDYFPDSL